MNNTRSFFLCSKTEQEKRENNEVKSNIYDVSAIASKVLEAYTANLPKMEQRLKENREIKQALLKKAS